MVVDNVGDPHLAAAWQLLAPGGSLQSVGWTSGQPAMFPLYFTIGRAKSLSSILNEGEVAAELAALVRLVEEGQLGSRSVGADRWSSSRTPLKHSAPDASTARQSWTCWIKTG